MKNDTTNLKKTNNSGKIINQQALGKGDKNQLNEISEG